MKEGLILSIIVAGLFIFINSQEQVVVNQCAGVKSCGKCIAVSPQCGWCGDQNYDKTNKDRCDLIEHLVAQGCSEANISNPSNIFNSIKSEPVKDGTGEGNAVQITPQQIHIKLRPKKPEKFTLTFRLAENYPVDLYYLMDLSNSMEDDKEKLAALGNKIAASMNDITKNFRLGFGSFVDKTVMPYVSTVPSKLLSPCDGCVSPYSFKNQLMLNKDTSLFETSVRNANVSGNLDAPEGGFDAIMQAIMCRGSIGWREVSRKLLLFSTDAGFHFAGDGKDSIGWRDQSRKMLLFSTDAGFHFAGDGKLGGIVKPNDGHCHMNAAGVYTEGENQDYPSVSQIATKIREKSVNVIFAVTEDQLKTYEKLSKYIEGSEATKLANDSSNIVTVIRNNYETITSKVKMNTRQAENITVKFMSSCKTGEEAKETNECEGLKIGDTVTFDISISVKDCPADPAQRTRSFEIYPVGLGERLNITLDLICECDCEQPDKEVLQSSLCNGKGTFECGQCTCDPGQYGKKCECDGSESTSEASLQACINPNSTSQVACSGRGECICGVCECFPRRANSAQKYSGNYCQCDDYSCSYHDNKLCGGKGVCKCGDCDCEENFVGEACECPTSEESCKTADGVICNGVGICECGVCKCNASTNYKGPTCQECPTCPGKCTENKNCALCVGFKTGLYTKEECDEKCKHVKTVPSIDEEEVKRRDDLNLCQFNDEEDDCRYFFTYKYIENNKVDVEVQETKVCPESVNILAIVLGTIGGIVLIGLILLLIWKLFTTIHDRREFAKFEKETQNAKWDTGENPIYQQATSTFKNPTYAGK